MTEGIPADSPGRSSDLRLRGRTFSCSCSKYGSPKSRFPRPGTQKAWLILRWRFMAVCARKRAAGLLWYLAKQMTVNLVVGNTLWQFRRETKLEIAGMERAC